MLSPQYGVLPEHDTLVHQESQTHSQIHQVEVCVKFINMPAVQPLAALGVLPE
ncbi:MAG: hypothetical protein Q8O99_04990 [bacterium]|nr:hypothetical protein [bacterium]